MKRLRNRPPEPWFGCPRMLLAVAGAALLGACEQETGTSATAATAPPPTVTVISVQPTEVTPGFGFNGRVVAIDQDGSIAAGRGGHELVQGHKADASVRHGIEGQKGAPA